MRFKEFFNIFLGDDLNNNLLLENTSQYLSSMSNQDQVERNEYMKFVKNRGTDYVVGSKLYAKLKNRSPQDIFGEKDRNKQFIIQSKNFNFSEFSSEDWDNFWLLSQHCDFDRSFQKYALSMIEKFQGTEHSHYQYLYDRISCGTTGSQKYGTQDLCNKDSTLT
jgi:hypothetical protein